MNPVHSTPAAELKLPPAPDRWRRSSGFQSLFTRTDPSRLVTISCIDYREGDLPGYHLTSAGNIPHRRLVDDLHLVLPGKEMLILRCHTDCAKSKHDVVRRGNESAEEYSLRVETHTLLRLWRDARRLLADPEVRMAVADGLRFCAARLDVSTGETTYFERESAALVQEMLAAKAA